MHRFILALSCFLMTLAAPISAQDLIKGLEASLNGDWTAALKEFKPLAEGGNRTAQDQLGHYYYQGKGVPQNYKEAVKWFILASEQGSFVAQRQLGNMYKNGEGVPQDYKEAIKWYRLAAEQGSSIAQIDLGGMYYQGKSVLADYVIAHMWYNISAANGNKFGAKGRETLAKKMTLEDISKA